MVWSLEPIYLYNHQRLIHGTPLSEQKRGAVGLANIVRYRESTLEIEMEREACILHITAIVNSKFSTQEGHSTSHMTVAPRILPVIITDIGIEGLRKWTIRCEFPYLVAFESYV